MKNAIKLLCTVFLMFSLSLFGCTQKSEKATSKNTSEKGNFIVRYIDVGQGDSMLIQCNNKNLLIDAGPRDSQEKLISYLKSLKIKKLDYIIATHPHEDHIGGMGQVIKTFGVGNFYAPKVQHNTKTFEYMVNQLKNKNLKMNVIKKGMGDNINLGPNTKVEVFSPINSKYDNLNNYSPIMKISYGKTSFLFTGDAEKEVEKEVLESGANIKANVLKFGHHGSSTSTTKEFFSKVNPSIGIISCGVNNKYGHPHKEILKLIKEKHLTVYRTDKDGNIVLESNGLEIIKK